MSPLSLSLVVLAAFIHATWNLLSKRAAAAGAAFVFASNVIALVLYLPWVGWVLAHNAPSWSLPVAFCLVLSAILHLGYNLCLQRGYQVADLSVVYPIARGTGPLLSSVGAFILLRETPSAQGILGLLAVVAGIGFITTQGDLSAFRRPRGLDGLRWGTATGSLIAGYTVVDGYCVKMLGIHPVVLDWLSNLLRFFMLAPVVLSNWSRAKEKMKGHWWLAFWVGVLSPLSYILVLSAIEMGAPLSLVAPAREMSMMVGALFGMLILGERVTAWRVVGCAILIGGVILLGSAKA
ncbi:DMT family transporter [Bradyrhizobium sp. 170]|uniref:DMT family transporter n=1 Tax=Bradyrhizobium sp. 170 TaxID=2782641 RepID=UPI001FFE4149|nr:DMT family transporter [Bradyrhizobium sp. 170]UPK06191.1 EamA family transporter [Bradyrhizobium sp. 170]